MPQPQPLELAVVSCNPFWIAVTKRKGRQQLRKLLRKVVERDTKHADQQVLLVVDVGKREADHHVLLVVDVGKREADQQVLLVVDVGKRVLLMVKVKKRKVLGGRRKRRYLALLLVAASAATSKTAAGIAGGGEHHPLQSWERALLLLDEMRERGFAPDVISQHV